jgi:polyvinyl alcohol dehydrogenase (cytochrome)
LAFPISKSKNRLFGLVVISLLVSVALLSGLPYTKQTSALTGSTDQTSWTSFTFDNSNSRYQASSSLNAGNVGSLKRAWFFETNYSITSTPVVQGGNVYFPDWNGTVYSVNVATGIANWHYNAGFAISSSLLLANGLVYIAGGPLGQTEVIALNENTGAVSWTKDLTTTYGNEGAIYVSPTIYNNLIYVGVSDAHAAGENSTTKEGIVFALDATSGSTVWSFTTMTGTSGGAAVWGSLVVDPSLNEVYFGTGNAYTNTSSSCTTCTLYSYSIIALSATSGGTNGKPLWYYQVYKSQNGSSPATTGGPYHIGDDLDFGSTPNLFSIVKGGVSYPAIGLGNKNGVYYILDRTNGASLYNLTSPNALVGEGIVGLAGFMYPSGTTNPDIFVPVATSGGGEVVAWDTSVSTSTPAWTFSTAGRMVGSVALIPGAVLFGDAAGYLYAVSMSNGVQLTQFHLPYGIEGGVTVAEGYVFVGDYDTSLGQSSSVAIGAGVSAFDVPASTTTTNTTTTTTTSSSSFGISDSAYKDGTTASSLSLTLTTTGKDVLVVFADSSASGGYDNVTNITGNIYNGLSFTSRQNVTAIPSTYRDLEEWYAIVPSQQALTFSVTVTWSTKFSISSTKLLAFLIQGANTTSPFDSSSSLPAIGKGAWPSITTNNANDIIFSYANVDNQSGIPPMSGFAPINPNEYYDANEYMIASSPQSLVVQFGGSVTTSGPIAQIVDAVQAAQPAKSTTSVSCSPGSVSAGSSTTCTAQVTGNNPTGTVSWQTSGSGTFSTNTCTLSSSGSCQVSYTPSSISPANITASYSGDSSNSPSSFTLEFPLPPPTSSTTTTTTTTTHATTAGSKSPSAFNWTLVIAGIVVVVIAIGATVAGFLVRRRRY